MMSHIISFILQTFQSSYNEDFLKLICENSWSYMNKVKPFLRVVIDASKKRADISKIREKKMLCWWSCTQGWLNFRKSYKISSQYQIKFLQSNCKKTEFLTLFCILTQPVMTTRIYVLHKITIALKCMFYINSDLPILAKKPQASQNVQSGITAWKPVGS